MSRYTTPRVTFCPERREWSWSAWFQRADGRQQLIYPQIGIDLQTWPSAGEACDAARLFVRNVRRVCDGIQ